jgi:integrase
MAEIRAPLTDAALRKLIPNGNRYEITDSIAVGLRVRVSAEGRISFILKARNAASKLQTLTLGQFPDISLKAAREQANEQRLALKAGRDINGEKRNARAVAAERAITAPTLSDLIGEFERRFSPNRRVWQPRGTRSTRSGARQVIERVYGALLGTEITHISEEVFARTALSYKRVKPTPTNATANGQVSRARAYRSPVLDWAAGRKSYAKIGSSRMPRIEVVSLANTHDPAVDDPKITGKRTRVLTEAELRAVLPFLIYPAPKIGNLQLAPERDYRPIAMRFLIFTAARLDEVCTMRWSHVDRTNDVWHKPVVKSTRGKVRSQDLPLSAGAMNILRQLPGWSDGGLDQFVFPNSTGKESLGNWTRFQVALHASSATKSWHRHDLRRTAATIMHSLMVPASTIEQILAHANPLKGENIGGAGSHYIQLARVLSNTRDPQEAALATLAQALEMIENG